MLGELLIVCACLAASCWAGWQFSQYYFTSTVSQVQILPSTHPQTPACRPCACPGHSRHLLALLQRKGSTGPQSGTNESMAALVLQQPPHAPMRPCAHAQCSWRTLLLTCVAANSESLRLCRRGAWGRQAHGASSAWFSGPAATPSCLSCLSSWECSPLTSGWQHSRHTWRYLWCSCSAPSPGALRAAAACALSALHIACALSVLSMAAHVIQHMSAFVHLNSSATTFMHSQQHACRLSIQLLCTCAAMCPDRHVASRVATLRPMCTTHTRGASHRAV